MIFFSPKICIKSRTASAVSSLLLVLAVLLSGFDAVKADGPYWHINSFNAANLDTLTGNLAMWSGVPSGTPGYITAPGYGNFWDDHLYWRIAVPDTTQPTPVRLMFVYNHDTQPGLDYFHVEWQDAGTFVSLAQVSGSNKETSGEFVTPAVFDQLWTISPGHYSGPKGDQIVLRLRVTSDSTWSDQDGYFDSFGAVQVDNILIELDGSPVSYADFETTGSDGGWKPHDQQAVAEYVQDQILGGSYGDFTLWMTDGPVDSTHVVRDVDPQVPDEQIPYPLAWVVMIDSIPEANWAHPCSWVVVKADLTTHMGPVGKEWTPSVFANMGAGPRVDFYCAEVTPNDCPSLEDPPSEGGVFLLHDPCLYAVLISGGENSRKNRLDYKLNLSSVYKTLRELGFPKANIFVYYATGSPLDLDDEEGDNDHATGSDVTDSANKAAIREKISSLCSELDGLRDVLFIYTSNHGSVLGLVLWDFNDNGELEDDEIYRPNELRLDTPFCRVCRLFITMDQCRSGTFINILNDGLHTNAALYTAATDREDTWGRRYMSTWEVLDHGAITMNAIHEHMVDNAGWFQTTPLMAEGVEGNGDVVLNSCCGDEICHVPLYTPFCLGEDTVTVEVDICNNLPDDHTYDLSFEGELLSPVTLCGIEGPTSFTLLDPTPVLVPSGDCATVRVKIARPEGMTEEFDISCYVVTAINMETTNTARCHGALWDRRDICALFMLAGGAFSIMEGQSGDVYYLVPGDPYEVNLRLYNTGSTLTNLDYQFEVIRSDMSGYPNNIVRLNGMQPGIPVTGVVPMPSVGDSTTIPVTVQFDLLDERAFYELVFSADTDDDTELEPVTSVGLRSVSDPTSVELIANLEPYWDNGNVVITWVLYDINSILTFDVYRRINPDGSYMEVRNAEITQNENQFVLLDTSAEPGTSYTYRINIIENDRLLTYFETSISTPSLKFVLNQNYPNPFNPMTTISFTLPEKAHVKVSIFTVEGKLIAVLLDETLDEGSKEITWNGRDTKGNRMSSGIYFYQLKVGEMSLTKKLVLLN
ncbi:MAG: T9SS type A sorting domain-containing protein [bacterium]|nr:MAG: T9SS type A sorting domain-containing protein [bacterium]